LYANGEAFLKSMMFGDDARRHFLLEPGVRFLNHGSFGATPRAVFRAAGAWRARMEASPDRFMREIVPKEVRRAASTLAVHLRARSEDLAFVENATAGINAVLRSLALQPSDEIVTTDHCYGAVRQAIRHVCERSGARHVELPIALPLRSAHSLYDSIAAGLTERTRLLVIDHIASPTGLIFPVARLVEAARAKGARVLVDGAHAPGQLDLDLPSLGADWYVGNCHKWLFAPRGCAFLWAHPEAQRGLHPLSVSHRYGQGLAAEFDWTGTRDFSSWLAIGDALAFHQAAGPIEARAYTHGLVVEAARRIADSWETNRDADDVLHASMIAIRLPERLVPPDGVSKSAAERLQAEWLERHALVVAINPHSNALWLRISAQIYNTPEDYEALARL
jgi:isopenicillin-N epimerase